MDKLRFLGIFILILSIATIFFFPNIGIDRISVVVFIGIIFYFGDKITELTVTQIGTIKLQNKIIELEKIENNLKLLAKVLLDLESVRVFSEGTFNVAPTDIQRQDRLKSLREIAEAIGVSGVSFEKIQAFIQKRTVYISFMHELNSFFNTKIVGKHRRYSDYAKIIENFEGNSIFTEKFEINPDWNIIEKMPDKINAFNQEETDKLNELIQKYKDKGLV